MGCLSVPENFVAQRSNGSQPFGATRDAISHGLATSRIARKDRLENTNFKHGLILFELVERGDDCSGQRRMSALMQFRPQRDQKVVVDLHRVDILLCQSTGEIELEKGVSPEDARSTDHLGTGGSCRARHSK